MRAVSGQCSRQRAYFRKFTYNDVICQWLLPGALGEGGLVSFAWLALTDEKSNAAKTVKTAREEVAETVYREKSVNSYTR